MNNLQQMGKLESKSRVTNVNLVMRLLAVHSMIQLLFAMIYYNIRGNNNFNGLDEESTFIDCLYFSFTTGSSVGYGDISPRSKYARILSMMHQYCVIGSAAQIILDWGQVEKVQYANNNVTPDE